MNPKTEEYIRQFIASSYIENNNEDLKTDRVGREELIKIKYQLSQYIETIIPNHQFLKLKLYSYTNKKLTSVNYQSLSTEFIDRWMESLYSATPVLKNELINVAKPSPSAMIGFKITFRDVNSFSFRELRN